MKLKYLRLSSAAVLAAAVCFSVSGITVTTGSNKEVLVDGKPFFPIMQWLQNASSMATQKQYGINTFLGQGDASTALAYCNAAQQQGVYAVPIWNAAQVDGVKSHPAFLGWVFGDEPDLQSNQIPASQIQTQYADCKAKDPSHITFLTVTANFYSEMTVPAWMGGSNTNYYNYPLATDVIGFDFYPVYGYCTPSWVYRVANMQDELANKFAKGKKSTFQWIECCKTSSEWCSIAARGANDGPYDYEIKDEVWLAIAKGANAIGYFTHSWKCPGYSQFCLSDPQIAMIKSVNSQITALTNVLCAPESKIILGLQVADPKGMVVTRLKEYNGSLYVIAVSAINRTGAQATQQAVFSIQGLNGPVQVYDENRTITANAGVFSDNFTNTNSVHIYVIPLTFGSHTAVKSAAAAADLQHSFLTTVGSSVKFTLPSGSAGATVRIFSGKGTLVRTLRNDGAIAAWDCRDNGGNSVGAGLFYAIISQSGRSSAVPILLH